MNRKVYNGINSSGTMAERAENVIFLDDNDVQTLLLEGKIQVDGFTIAHLRGDLIEKREISGIGKPGFYHIPVATLGDEFSTAFVVPAERKSEAGASIKGGDEQ